MLDIKKILEKKKALKLAGIVLAGSVCGIIAGLNSKYYDGSSIISKTEKGNVVGKNHTREESKKEQSSKKKDEKSKKSAEAIEDTDTTKESSTEIESDVVEEPTTESVQVVEEDVPEIASETEAEFEITSTELSEGRLKRMIEEKSGMKVIAGTSDIQYFCGTSYIDGYYAYDDYNGDNVNELFAVTTNIKSGDYSDDEDILEKGDYLIDYSNISVWFTNGKDVYEVEKLMSSPEEDYMPRSYCYFIMEVSYEGDKKVCNVKYRFDGTASVPVSHMYGYENGEVYEIECEPDYWIDEETGTVRFYE